MIPTSSLRFTTLAGAAVALALATTPAAAQVAESIERLEHFAANGFDFSEPGELWPTARSGDRVVKGAPFCAEAVHEQIQWLHDGSGAAPNRIVRQNGWKLCRDGEGRLRQEVDRNGSRRVYLRDPVARESWVLDPARKTARRSGLAAIDGLDREAMRDFSDRMRDWAREMSERVKRGIDGAPPLPAPAPAAPTAPLAPAAAPAPVIITRSADAGPRETEVRVIRLPAGADGLDAELPLPGPVQWRARSLAPRGPGAVSPLPARDIEGLRVNGERTTWVIEAGKVGNERAIQLVREVWTSPDLMLTVLSRDLDPRVGEEVYRLKNVRRGEPDPALMKVPADYELRGRATKDRAPAPTPAG